MDAPDYLKVDHEECPNDPINRRENYRALNLLKKTGVGRLMRGDFNSVAEEKVMYANMKDRYPLLKEEHEILADYYWKGSGRKAMMARDMNETWAELGWAYDPVQDLKERTDESMGRENSGENKIKRENLAKERAERKVAKEQSIKSPDDNNKKKKNQQQIDLPGFLELPDQEEEETVNGLSLPVVHDTEIVRSVRKPSQQKLTTDDDDLPFSSSPRRSHKNSLFQISDDDELIEADFHNDIENVLQKRKSGQSSRNPEADEEDDKEE
jgi:hypothetical protein